VHPFPVKANLVANRMHNAPSYEFVHSTGQLGARPATTSMRRLVLCDAGPEVVSVDSVGVYVMCAYIYMYPRACKNVWRVYVCVYVCICVDVSVCFRLE